MSDLYQRVANSPLGRPLINALNLPTPVTLERFSSSQKSFLEGDAFIGAAKNGTALSIIGRVLTASTAKISCPQAVSGKLVSSEEIKTALSTQVSVLDLGQLPEGKKYKALVFDASGIENGEDLRAVYDFFHPLIRKIAKCGRIIIIGQSPQSCDTPEKSAAQQALEGFIRSAAKEIGKNGATAQVLYFSPGAEEALESPLRFILSAKSAYVSGQVIYANKFNKVSQINWNKPLQDKIALVTGASRGIGESIAKTLARDGAKVICLDVPAAKEALNEVATAINGEILAIDITDKEAPNKIAAFLKENYNGLDIIIHNAGITRDKTLGRMPEHFWDLLIDINLSAEERINHALFEQQLINKNGRIVCVSSIGGIAGNFGQTNYAASKAGVIGYVESLSKRLKSGITINAVAPGFIETQMTAAMPFTIREAGRRMNSLSQGGQPQDVAEMIAFYAHPASFGINGNVVRVCGQSLIGK